MFIPTRVAALTRLENFLPRAGHEYTQMRNFTETSDEGTTVSELSPWIRVRLLTEWEVLQRVTDAQGTSNASKYIDEVCWRTYWKGWLEMRPRVWADYLRQRKALLNDFSGNHTYNDTIAARTGITFLDTLTEDLIRTGYLHNHYRMWYASIWIHTLKLPWELGADWFFRHLLDGDPASNTLSWRWVAGLHTKGKAYLASAENINHYTAGRFAVGEINLASEPISVGSIHHPPRQELRKQTDEAPSNALPILVTDEDVRSTTWLGKGRTNKTLAGFFPLRAYRDLEVTQQVIDFRRACIQDSVEGPVFTELDDLLDWLVENSLDGVSMAIPAVGLWDVILPELEHKLTALNMRLELKRHWWDAQLFPQASHGFFRFKKAIPDALQSITDHHH